MELSRPYHVCDNYAKCGNTVGEYLVGDKLLCFSCHAEQAQPPLLGERPGLGALFG